MIEDCCAAQQLVTPGGIPYQWHEDACRALEDLAVTVEDSANHCAATAMMDPDGIIHPGAP